MTATLTETPCAATAAIPVRRGCGLRLEGGTYWEYGLAPGDDLADFLIDVPLPLPTLLDLAAVGVKMIERGGVSHVVDWVGAEFYPNVADLLEEAQRFGLSRRLSGGLDFARLTPASRILLVHARAYVANSAAYGPYPCPLERHLPDTPACAGVWWRDLDGGTALADPADPLAVLRRLPSCSYRGYRRPEGVTPRYRPAFFASFPASRLVVVRSADGRHTGTLSRVRGAALPVVEVEA
jgi:hypothetical protein